VKALLPAAAIKRRRPVPRENSKAAVRGNLFGRVIGIRFRSIRDEKSRLDAYEGRERKEKKKKERKKKENRFIRLPGLFTATRAIRTNHIRAFPPFLSFVRWIQSDENRGEGRESDSKFRYSKT